MRHLVVSLRGSEITAIQVKKKKDEKYKPGFELGPPTP